MTTNTFWTIGIMFCIIVYNTKHNAISLKKYYVTN